MKYMEEEITLSFQNTNCSFTPPPLPTLLYLDIKEGLYIT